MAHFFVHDVVALNNYLLRSFTIMYMESKVADIGLHHVKKPVLESGKGNFSVWTIYPVR
jgi:hypothetical protein